MRRPAERPRYLCVVLHDVTPLNASVCMQMLDLLQRLARETGVTVPVTLLVVPSPRGSSHDTPADHLGWLRGLCAEGHELALHGLTHHDDGPPPRTWRERLRRHHYTAGEGEFAALDLAAAHERLAAAKAWAARHRLPVRGFVAPAWLLSADADRAVRQAGFDYSCRLDHIESLPDGRRLHARSLVFSTRSAWRRVASRAWVRSVAWQQRRTGAPLMRFELHPGDLRHDAVRRCWVGLLRQALVERQPLLLHEAAALAHAGGTSAAGHAARQAA